VSGLDGKGARQLTPVKRKDHQRRNATWSPDGMTIAYVDDTGPRRFGSSPQELWIVKANGTGKKKIATFKLFQIYNQRPSWTADGKELAFLLPDGGVVLAVDVRTRKVRELMRLPRGTQAMQLSPNGTFVGFTKSDAAGSIFVRRLGGGTKRVAKASPGGWNDGFAWSPDSQRLVVLTESDKRPAVVSATGGAVREVLAEELRQGYTGWERPIWSPDGKTILTQLSPSGREGAATWDRFRTINLATGQPTLAGPGAGSCRIQTGGDPDTGKRPPPSPCPVSDPSWQPRK
jgi:Tol biopolymer transport system component